MTSVFALITLGLATLHAFASDDASVVVQTYIRSRDVPDDVDIDQLADAAVNEFRADADDGASEHKDNDVIENEDDYVSEKDDGGAIENNDDAAIKKELDGAIENEADDASKA